MKIEATTTFLHGTERYEEGKTYDVKPDDAKWFVFNGWATSPRLKGPQTPPPGDVSLEVHSARQGHSSKVT